MRIMHVALGGCLSSPPIPFGLTEDTGGHIAYVLGAAFAQARRSDVAHVDIVTRRFHDIGLGPLYSEPFERVTDKVSIRRIPGRSPRYLEKAELEAELPELTNRFLEIVETGPRPDVLHAHFADAGVLCRAASDRFGVPWLYTPHSLGAGHGAPDPDAVADGRITRERDAIAHAGGIIVSSRDEAERQVAAHDPDAAGRTHRVNPGRTQPHGTDPSRAQALLAPYLRDPAKPIILAIARPVGKKNLGALVRAYGQSEALRSAANLVIVAGIRKGLTGNSPQADAVHAELFDLTDRLDLWGQVALPRTHAAEDVPALYALAAAGGAFANPAVHEPFGLTLIEAAQAGVPVVATTEGGPRDILGALGCDTLVEPDDTDALAKALLRALALHRTPERLRLIQRRADAVFNWDRWAERSLAIAARLSAPHQVPQAPRAILISDIDGTLTGSRRGASAFGHYRTAAGPALAFAVATGRSISEARGVLDAWSLPVPDVFITSVGTEIWHHAPAGGLSPDRAFAARIAEGWQRDAIAARLEALGLLPQVHYEQRAFKLSYTGSAGDAERARAQLAKARLPARVIHSHDTLIDVIPLRAGKWAAAQHVAGEFGLGSDAIVCAGDSGNDLDMLSHCRHAIVPSNAHRDLAALRGTAVLRTAAAHAEGVVEGLEALGAIWGTGSRLEAAE